MRCYCVSWRHEGKGTLSPVFGKSRNMTCAGAGRWSEIVPCIYHQPVLLLIIKANSATSKLQNWDTPILQSFMTLSLLTARTSKLLTTSSTASARLLSLSTQLGARPIGLRTMASLPKTMKAVYIEKTGETDVLQYKTDVPVPELKDGEVLVKNEFIGINYIDT